MSSAKRSLEKIADSAFARLALEVAAGPLGLLPKVAFAVIDEIRKKNFEEFVRVTQEVEQKISEEAVGRALLQAMPMVINAERIDKVIRIGTVLRNYVVGDIDDLEYSEFLNLLDDVQEREITVLAEIQRRLQEPRHRENPSEWARAQQVWRPLVEWISEHLGIAVEEQRGFFLRLERTGLFVSKEDGNPSGIMGLSTPNFERFRRYALTGSPDKE